MTFPTALFSCLRACVCVLLLLAFSSAATAAPYAAMVMDARTGQVIHSRNADTRLHPASLTKMMTLYIVFDAVERGEISLDTEVLISKNAASEPPSKLGLKAGQRIQLRYLIRAAAVKSANDAATALGEAISGSEAAFARRMTRMAKAMGMSNTTFRNAHGLTESGHLSTARDMTILGRQLFYDFPEYYNIFSRRTTSAGSKMVRNTNSRLLDAYRGADGIKTGYTRAAGYNLVASAERGNERIIATVFGGRSTAWRNARVAELLDMGFDKAPSSVQVRKPKRPVPGTESDGGAVSPSGLLAASPRPRSRPTEAPPEELLIALQDGIADVLAEVAVAETQAAQPEVTTEIEVATAEIETATPTPEPLAVPVTAQAGPAPAAVLPASLAAASLAAPPPRPTFAPTAVTASLAGPAETGGGPVVVTRMSTSGGRQWAINVGRFTTRHEAEKMLLQTALTEIGTLDEALRKVVQSPKGFEANFVGLTEHTAELACRRLLAQNVSCTPIGPT